MSSCKILKYYHLANCFVRYHIPIMPGIIMRICRVLYSCELPYTAKLGKDVLFVHNGLGVVIHGRCIIGDGTKIYQNVTIGGRNNKGFPVIGKNVFIGANALILGGVHVGDNAQIGAGAIVIEDVPANAIAIGQKARIIEK